MCTLDEFRGTRNVTELPKAKPLDEAIWQAWLTKGREQERRTSFARLNAVKWFSIVCLFAAAGFWLHLAPYEVAIRFIVAGGAVIVMLQAFRAQHNTVGAIFGALALLYNPVAPLFSFSGDWQRALVVLSAAPFIGSLARRNPGMAYAQ